MADDLSVGQRLAGLLDELGIERAHVADGDPWLNGSAGLSIERPDSLASLTALLPLPDNLDRFRVHADRLSAIFGGENPLASATRDELRSWPGTHVVDLPADAEAYPWTDLVSEHVELVVDTIHNTAAREPALADYRGDAREGWSHEVRYRVTGVGPPLLLFPVFLAPTQWDAAVERLGESFTTIRLSGPHLGVVQIMEWRAKTNYLDGVRAVVDRLEIQPGHRVLEVGCAAGPLTRDVAQRTGASVVGLDISRFLLDEAEAITERAGIASIEFCEGNAEDLPFESDSFDAVFSSTVFEECDADRAMAEMRRVLKPGGRAGVIVRGPDLPAGLNLELSEGLAERLNAVRPTESPSGCADASLYRRFGEHFAGLQAYPFWMVFTPPMGGGSGSPLAPILASAQAAGLNDDELDEVRRAASDSWDMGTLRNSMGHHAVVGVKA